MNRPRIEQEGEAGGGGEGSRPLEGELSLVGEGNPQASGVGRMTSLGGQG